MKLIQCRYSSGQRVPLLVQTENAAPLPVLVPFIYVQLKLRCRAYNTASAHLRAIQTFYTYAKSRDLNIDEAILACHFESILALLDGYAIWLQSGRQADNLVARIGKAETASFPQIDTRTRDQYLRLLKLYLSWCVTRYIPRALQNPTTLADNWVCRTKRAPKQSNHSTPLSSGRAYALGSPVRLQELKSIQLIRNLRQKVCTAWTWLSSTLKRPELYENSGGEEC